MKTRSSSATNSGRAPNLASAPATSGAIGTERTLARPRSGQLAVRVARADADHGAGEVDVAPAQGQQLAATQAGERPGQEDGGVLSLAAARTRAWTSSGEYTSMSPLRLSRGFSTSTTSKPSDVQHFPEREPASGLEPETPSLQVKCSAN
jgi:hypothetical protein